MTPAAAPPRLAIGIALAGVAALIAHAFAWDFVSDDTFINLRYSRNLLDGHGLVFNVGDRVEAYSSLPLVLVVAALGGVGLDLVYAVRALSLVCACVCVLAVVALVRALAPRGGGLSLLAAASLPAASAPLACWALGGMDAPLFGCVVLATVQAARRLCAGARAPWLGLVAGLCAWTRPEGVAVGGVVVALTWVVARKERAAAAAGVFLACVAALFVFRFAYFGDLLPNTYYAKIGAPSLDLLGRGGEHLADFARDQGGAMLLLLPFAAGFWRRDATWWLLAAAAAALLACVAIEGGDGLPMYRFLVPVVPLWSALAASLVAEGIAVLGRGPRSMPWLAVLVGAWLSVARPSPASVHYLRYRGHKDFEIEAWTAAGKWLRANAPAGASVACVPIGAVGYYSGLPLIDMLGLTDKHIARAPLPTGGGWAGHEKRDGKYVLSRAPTFLLLGNVRVLDQALPVDHPEFVRIRHEAVEAREGDIYGAELVRHYEPKVASLGAGLFLHYLRRRS